MALENVICEHKKLHLIFEFVDMDLRHYIEKKKRLSEKHIKVSNLTLRKFFTRSFLV